MTFPLVSLHFQESEYDTLSPEIFFFCLLVDIVDRI